MARRNTPAASTLPAQTLADARALGAKAFADGRMCTPALDPAILALIGANNGHALALMKAWGAGWTAANLAAPID